MNHVFIADIAFHPRSLENAPLGKGIMYETPGYGAYEPYAEVHFLYSHGKKITSTIARASLESFRTQSFLTRSPQLYYLHLQRVAILSQA